MQWLGFASDVIGVLGGIFAFFAWIQTLRLRKDQQRERERQDAPIRIILQAGEEKYELPVPVRRAELTRAEVLGRLGMIPLKSAEEFPQTPAKGGRFSIKYLNDDRFLLRLNQVVTGDGNDVIIVTCDDSEFRQFKF